MPKKNKKVEKGEVRKGKELIFASEVFTGEGPKSDEMNTYILGRLDLQLKIIMDLRSRVRELESESTLAKMNSKG